MPEHIELTRSTEEEKQSQLKRLQDVHQCHAHEAPAMLERLMRTVIDNGNVFAALMDAVCCYSLGQITNALFEVGAVPQQYVVRSPLQRGLPALTFVSAMPQVTWLDSYRSAGQRASFLWREEGANRQPRPEVHRAPH